MATELGLYREAARLVGTAPPSSLAEESLPRRTFDDAWVSAVRMCLSLGWWRFAFETEPVVAAASGLAEYPFAFARSAAWLRTHSVGVGAGTRFIRVDWHERSGSEVLTKFAAVTHRYVRFDTGLASANSATVDAILAGWPEVFAKVVAARLAFEASERLSQNRAIRNDCNAILEAALAVARESESLPPPLQLPEHAVEFAARHLLEQGWWRFSVKTAELVHAAALPAVDGYAARAARPPDWLRTMDVSLIRGDRWFPVDRREEDGTVHTDAMPAMLRYVSDAALDPLAWTEGFRQAVDAYLSLEALRWRGAKDAEAAKLQYDKVLASALAKDGLPAPLMLGERAIGRATRSMLEEGIWRFASRSAELVAAAATPSPGYAVAVEKPADWLRTVRVWRQVGSEEREIAFRDEGGFLHVDAAPVVIRYLSIDALDPAEWTDLFTRAWFALLRHQAAIDTGLPEGEVQARYASWRVALEEARLKDGMAERPRMNRDSVFLAARRGGGPYGRNRAQG